MDYSVLVNPFSLTHKSILLQEKGFMNVSLRPPPPPLCPDTFQSKIDNQFKMCPLTNVDNA